MALPRQLLDAARIQAIRQKTALQEVVAEALEDYLRRAKKAGDRQ
jgi:hypothetical protein